jgi:hypothetical protein
VPPDNEADVMDKGTTAAATAMLSDPVTDWGDAAESLTVTAKLELPDAFGVPLITPAVERVNPAGNEPEAKLHL